MLVSSVSAHQFRPAIALPSLTPPRHTCSRDTCTHSPPAPTHTRARQSPPRNPRRPESRPHASSTTPQRRRAPAPHPPAASAPRHTPGAYTTLPPAQPASTASQAPRYSPYLVPSSLSSSRLLPLPAPVAVPGLVSRL